MVKQGEFVKSGGAFSLRDTPCLLHKTVEQNGAITIKGIYNSYLLLAADPKFKEARTYFFAMRKSERIAKHLEKIDGA